MKEDAGFLFTVIYTTPWSKLLSWFCLILFLEEVNLPYGLLQCVMKGVDGFGVEWVCTALPRDLCFGANEPNEPSACLELLF